MTTVLPAASIPWNPNHDQPAQQPARRARASSPSVLRTAAQADSRRLVGLFPDPVLATEQLVLFLTESVSGATMTRDYIKQLIFMCVDVIVQMNVVNRKRQITEIYYEPAFKRQHMV